MFILPINDKPFSWIHGSFYLVGRIKTHELGKKEEVGEEREIAQLPRLATKLIASQFNLIPYPGV